jgi:hypothetical protein
MYASMACGESVGAVDVYGRDAQEPLDFDTLADVGDG